MAVGIDFSMLNEYSHIQALELELERTQKEYDVTCEKDTSRRLKIDVLLLQEENADLQSQLLEKEERIDALEEDLEGHGIALQNLNNAMNNMRLQLQLKLKEAERLSAEVNSFQSLATESAKVLEDKLSLARELNQIRPEVEHLRAQQATNDKILSEKHTLQRELQTVKVELENEKRAVEKALARDQGSSLRETQLQSELDTYKIDLAKEKTLRQKFENERNKGDGSYEAQNAALESRLEDYRAKLKSAKEQIKNTRAELEEARKANERLLQEKTRLPPAIRGKRSFSQIDADATIGTPDGFPPKKTIRASALLGERSEFPITPFLNPTAKLSIETPADELQEEAQAVQTEESAPVVTAVKTKKPAVPKAAAKPKPKLPKTTKILPPKKLDQVEEVAEEEEQEDARQELATEPVRLPVVVEEKAPPAKAIVPKKKRRVLGAGSSKTLFDDEDDNITGKVDTRGGLDDFKFAMPKRVNLAAKGPTVLAKKGNVGGLSGFGSFSPLKKDRKLNK